MDSDIVVTEIENVDIVEPLWHAKMFIEKALDALNSREDVDELNRRNFDIILANLDSLIYQIGAVSSQDVTEPVDD